MCHTRFNLKSFCFTQAVLVDLKLIACAVCLSPLSVNNCFCVCRLQQAWSSLCRRPASTVNSAGCSIPARTRQRPRTAAAQCTTGTSRYAQEHARNRAFHYTVTPRVLHVACVSYIFFLQGMSVVRALALTPLTLESERIKHLRVSLLQARPWVAPYWESCWCGPQSVWSGRSSFYTTCCCVDE